MDSHDYWERDPSGATWQLRNLRDSEENLSNAIKDATSAYNGDISHETQNAIDAMEIARFWLRKRIEWLRDGEPR